MQLALTPLRHPTFVARRTVLGRLPQVQKTSIGANTIICTLVMYLSHLGYSYLRYDWRIGSLQGYRKPVGRCFTWPEGFFLIFFWAPMSRGLAYFLLKESALPFNVAVLPAFWALFPLIVLWMNFWCPPSNYFLLISCSLVRIYYFFTSLQILTFLIYF